MHIPDGFIDVPTALVTGAVSAGVVALAAKKTAAGLGERTVPLLGVTAAFIFAAQMLNFPIAAGTSGHFLGALLAVALLGPWAATLVLTVVVAVQALVMGDGGLTALGANVLNMAVIGVFVGGGTFYLLKRVLPSNPSGYFLALALASWASIVLGTAAVALELAVSGTVPLGVALPTMTAVHMVIGLGEALITVVVVAGVLAARPDLVVTYPQAAEDRTGDPATGLPAGLRMTRRWRMGTLVLAGLVVALALGVFVSPFASGSPDGLERVAIDRGFEKAAPTDPVWSLSPFADYQFPWLGEGRLSTAVAALAGTLLLLVVILLLGRALGRPDRSPSPDGRSAGPPPPGLVAHRPPE
jgi:cobalt/nickel transport system permease protein